MSSVPERDVLRAGWLPAGYRLGRYEVLSKLASGGMARVYVANAQGAAGFERLVAIKVLHSNLAYEEEFIRMFLDEARLAAGIRHPNVVATIDISDTADTGYFLVMEYIEGDHLGALLASAHKLGERMPMPVVMRVVIDALSGLGAAHDLRDEDGSLLNLVHRDVSPHNVLVGRDGVARLTDFGVAKAEDRLANTRDGQVKGKIAYMAPEQAAVGRCDSRSDLFAMAIVLWECATGQRLFRAENSAATLHRLLHEEIVAPSTIDRALAPLDAVLLKSLAREPENRFQTAEEFIDALERVAPQFGGVAPRRLVTRSVERYAGEKLERDRRLIESALVSLRNGQPMRSEPAPAMAESSSPSRTQQRIRTGMTPAAGTVPRLFTSARVPRMDIEVTAEATSPDVAFRAPPPPLGGDRARGWVGREELLIVQARRRTRITRAVCTIGLLAAAGVAGWLWYDGRPSARPTTSVPSAGPAQTEPALPAVPAAPAANGTPEPVIAPESALARDLERVVQPPSERPLQPTSGEPAAGNPSARGRERGTQPRSPSVPSTGTGPATPASATTPSLQVTPTPADTQKEDGLLPNPYRHD
ncbi:MAG TPA: protein kinase [Polyangiales bacterium]|nr:protein kinase [Polyangiales bacterium]